MAIFGSLPGWKFIIISKLLNKAVQFRYTHERGQKTSALD